jgi:protein TonB
LSFTKYWESLEKQAKSTNRKSKEKDPPFNGKKCACIDLAYAAELGDKEAVELLWNNCAELGKVICDINSDRMEFDLTNRISKFHFYRNDSTFVSIRNTKNELISTEKFGYVKFSSFDKLQDSTMFDSDTPPEYLGGMQQLQKTIANSIRYPKLESQKNITGKVIVEFIVCEDGNICSIKIIEGVSKGIDKEVLRVISNLDKFKPALRNGIPTKSKLTMPIKFGLE